MKHAIAMFIGMLIGAIVFGSLAYTTNDSLGTELRVFRPGQGGTGTSTAPDLGDVLVGLSDGTYAPRATSTLGITALGDGTSNFLFDGTNLTPSTTPVGIVVNGTSTLATTTATGAIVIGTTTPALPFEVWSGGLRKFGVNATGVNLIVGNSNGGSISFASSNHNISVSSNMFQFNTTQSLGYNFSGGNVGISTTSPSRKLTVGGDAWIGGNLTATGTLTVTPLTSALTLTGADGAFAEYAGTSCTNQFVRSLSALGVATCETVDISADTNLSADGTEIVLTGDALSLGTALTFTTGTSTTSFFSALGTFTNLVVNTLATFLNVVVTGLLDVGGGSLEIPNGTAPTVDALGEIAVDSTYGQLKYFDGGTTHVLTGTTTRSFSIASTTSGTGGSFNTATTTFLLANNPEATTLIGWYCQATTTGSVNVRFGDGTNWTNDANCSTGGTTYATSNNTFTAFENFQVQIGSSASSPNRVTITTFTSKTAQ